MVGGVFGSSRRAIHVATNPIQSRRTDRGKQPWLRAVAFEEAVPMRSLALARAPAPSAPTTPPLWPIYGGPDRPRRALRDLLERKVDEVPSGGAIAWMTYYFRDEALAEALIRAHRRGVHVKVCLEGRPRLVSANRRVIAILNHPDRGIGNGLRVVQHLLPLHLHTKLYCFSGPQPAVLIGSFNPSGNLPEDPGVLKRIGDQDRGHNLLVEFNDAETVSALTDRIADLHASERGFRWPLRSSASPLLARDAEIYCSPFLGRNPLHERLAALPSKSVLRIAASHVRDFDVARCLAGLVRRGVEVHLLTGGSGRRSPSRIGEYLAAGGIRVSRFAHPDKLPMHAKFMLADGPMDRWVAFGSYNLTRTSRWLNQEMLAFSSDPNLWSSLDARWHEMMSDRSVQIQDRQLKSASIIGADSRG